MPIYEYACPKCNHRFEELVASARLSDKVKCPQCGTKPTQQFSSFGVSMAPSRSSSAPSCHGCPSAGGCPNAR